MTGTFSFCGLLAPGPSRTVSAVAINPASPMTATQQAGMQRPGDGAEISNERRSEMSRSSLFVRFCERRE